MRDSRSQTKQLKSCVFALLALVAHVAHSNPEGNGISSDQNIATSIASIAETVAADYRDSDRARYLSNLAYLQVARDDYAAATATFDDLHRAVGTKALVDRTLALEIYARAQRTSTKAFAAALAQTFEEKFSAFDNQTAIEADWILGTPPQALAQQFKSAWAQYQQTNASTEGAVEIVKSYINAKVYQAIGPYIDALVSEDDERRYIIDNDALIHSSGGAVLSALVVRDRTVTTPQSSALLFTIYTNPYMNLQHAKRSAAHGYVGVVADTRGKRLSTDKIEPWEREGEDTYAVIDWIAKQSWSNGSVGMYGSSYSAFAQWAAAKHLHPALKTIVPSAATHPGFGLPMQNNVFINANYAWNFYVANNRYLDNDAYFDRDRWSTLDHKWFVSGRPFLEIDAVDGTANPVLQKQLQHPSFDRYWQSMTAYGTEFAHINIPVLSITGYFDDAQVSAIRYLQEHYKYNKHADHYLVIGPYDHFGAGAPYKSPIVKNYAIDPVAQFDTVELTYAWFDHIMKGGPRPALLQDRINFEVMGANEWRHAPAIDRMSTAEQVFYLSSANSSEPRVLSRSKPAKRSFIDQTVDFADRSTQNNLYPVDAVTKGLLVSSGVSFISEPLPRPITISGMITAELRVAINKRDMDPTFALYEVSPSGEYFILSYFLGRASYAKDMTTRHLLQPNRIEIIPIRQTPLVSRRLQQGSRLLLVVDVNKNEHAQVNYGTGRDVSDESIADASEPLRVRWRNDSYIRVPISVDTKGEVSSSLRSSISIRQHRPLRHRELSLHARSFG